MASSKQISVQASQEFKHESLGKLETKELEIKDVDEVNIDLQLQNKEEVIRKVDRTNPLLASNANESFYTIGLNNEP